MAVPTYVAGATYKLQAYLSQLQDGTLLVRDICFRKRAGAAGFIGIPCEA